MKACPLAKELTSCRNPGDFEHTGSHWAVHVEPSKLLDAVQSLDEQGFFLEDVLGLDATEGIEVIYHFDHFTTPGRVTVRTLVGHENPELPSIAAIYPGAEWHERETADFYGVAFADIPNDMPLLLDDAHEGPPPLLKSGKDRVSIYALFPNYDIADCRPEFLKEEGEAPAEASEKAEGEESAKGESA